MTQQEMFYDDIYDAVNKAISASGKSRKELSFIIYPGCSPETAASKFTRALNPENQDVNLTVEMVRTVMKECRPDDIIYYLCDEYGFDRPTRKNKEDFRRELKKEINDISKLLKSLTQQVERMEVS